MDYGDVYNQVKKTLCKQQVDSTITSKNVNQYSTKKMPKFYAKKLFKELFRKAEFPLVLDRPVVLVFFYFFQIMKMNYYAIFYFTFCCLFASWPVMVSQFYFSLLQGALFASQLFCNVRIGFFFWTDTGSG